MPSTLQEISDSVVKFLIKFFRLECSGSLLAIVILSISIELVTPGKPFFHPSNIMTILNNSAAIGVIAGGMTLVVLSAGIDLSVGSVMGMTAALTGYLVSFWGFSPGMAIFSGFGIGALVGMVNGSLVAYLKMPAFIVTLAGLSVWRGTGHLTTGARATPKLPETFYGFGRHNPLAWLRDGFQDGSLPDVLIPLGEFVDENWITTFRTFQMSLIIFIAFFVFLALIVNNTRFGRYVYAIGSNESGASQAGINTKAYKLMTYLFCSLSAALGALLFLGRAPYAKSDYGQMWELDAIAAVVIGGTSLFGGKGTLWGTFLGVILLKLINNGLTLAQLETFWQMVVTGIIILIAVGIDIVRRSRSAMKTQKMMTVIAMAMAFFAFLTPASLYTHSWIVVHEHYSAEEIKLEGGKLAREQSKRLQSVRNLETHEEIMFLNIWPSIFLGGLVVASLIPLWLPGLVVYTGIASLFLFMVIPLQILAYKFGIPFLILGCFLMLASGLVPKIFERARNISVIN